MNNEVGKYFITPVEGLTVQEDLDKEAEQEKEHELQDDDNPACNHRLLGRFSVCAGENPLDDEMIRTVRGKGEECTADDAGYDVI